MTRSGRWTRAAALALALWTPTQARGLQSTTRTFVERLGRDTLAIERVTVRADRVTSTLVLRSPAPRIVRTELALEGAGAPTGLRVDVGRLEGGRIAFRRVMPRSLRRLEDGSVAVPWFQGTEGSSSASTPRAAWPAPTRRRPASSSVEGRGRSPRETP